MSTVSIGKEGEQKAVGYLIENNHQILRKNYRKITGELDIVSLKNDTIYFIEVKNWLGGFVHPLETFHKKKRNRMRMVASYFFLEMNIPDDRYKVSFSLLSISKEKIDFFQDLF
ncbi:MAG: YraN family protein [Leptospiraceae bacterium]|nr:YraN family protein [Leptospiraceae bacterium]